MKSLIKFLILILVVLAVGFIAWSAIDKSLFGDAELQIPPQEETGIPTKPAPALEAPTSISSEEAFGTTADSSPARAMDISCTNASEAIGIIYDMHMENKTTAEISQYLAGLEKFNQTEIEIFNEITESIKNAPSEQLLSRQEMVEQFKLQCEAVESE